MEQKPPANNPKESEKDKDKKQPKKEELVNHKIILI